MNKVFITGANGFVGKTLSRFLVQNDISYTAGERSLYGAMESQKRWSDILAGHDVVVHLAARVHVMDETEKDPLVAFRKVNVEATLNLAVGARAAGVKRFIFVSSIKVNGEETQDVPFSASDMPLPSDPYGVSKMEAEIALLNLHEPGKFEIVIIRPPLIYGPGVKANFEKLFWLVKKDFPLPFAAVKNKRSLVSIYNLCDLIITCINHPNAGGEIFLVSDDHDYSLKELLQVMGKTLNKSPRLIYVPVGLMKFGAVLLGKRTYVQRLFGNLQVDISKTKNRLNWKPRYTFEDTFKNA